MSDIKLLAGTYLPFNESYNLYKSKAYKLVKLGNYKETEIFKVLPDFITVCSTGNLELLKIYVKYQYGLTQVGLRWAVEKGNFKIVYYLCEVAHLYPTIETCYKVAEYARFKILKYFRKKGILLSGEYDPSSPSIQQQYKNLLYNMKPILEYPILEWAVVSGDLKVLKYLISLDMIPSEKTLNVASKLGYVEIVDFLIKAGIKPTNSTFYFSYHNKKNAVVTYLLNLGFLPTQILNIYK